MKHFRTAVSLMLAASMAIGVSLTCAVPVASAASATGLAATRYRYPISRFENANYSTGAIIDNNTKTAAYLFTDTPKRDGKGNTMLFAATVENYDMFNMKLGKNRALLIDQPADRDPAAADSYNSVKITLGNTVGTNPAVMPESFKGISSSSTDHGVMFHVEFTGADGTLNNGGYRDKVLDDKGSWVAEKTYSNHITPYLGFTFQEGDYKADGKPVKKAGTVQSTALHMKPGAKLTLVWTKSVTYTSKDKMTVVKQEANGKGVKDKDGNYVYEEIIPTSHKAGEVMSWTCETYNVDGSKNESGTMNFPRDFCGYVIVPFSEMSRAWSSNDVDGKITFRNVMYMYFTQSLFWYREGQVWLDEICLYGPSFAKCNGAYDYGNVTYANHKDSLNNRKAITVAATSTTTSKVVSNVSVATNEIKTAVTLKSKDGKVILEAPTAAKLTSSTAFTAEEPEQTDFNKALFEKLFGADKTKYAAYTVYLGADGDVEPADYCKLTFPIPAGIDAAKAAVYSVDGEIKTPVANAVIDTAKKTITIPVMELGTFVVAEATAEEGSEENTESAVSETSAATSAGTESLATSETNGNGGSLTWLWIVIGVVVVAGIGVAVFFVLRNKKQGGNDDPDTDETGNDDTPEA